MASSSLADLILASQGKPLYELMASLVRIPSVSGQEADIMEFAAHHLESRGLDVQTVGRPGGRANVIATLATGEPPVVVLNGHLDTVPQSAPEQWRTDPYKTSVSNGRVYGLGTFDMKGSCAAMMLSLDVLRQYRGNLPGTIQLQLVCDEEADGYWGTPYLLELIERGELPKPNHVIVGEFTGLQVMTAERGSFKLLAHFHGRATHTATSREEGRNAIFAASQAVTLLEKDLDIEHPEVGRAVMSVNQIHGGNYRSQVPDLCTIQIDRRMIPGETMESVIAGIEATIETLRPQIPWLDFQVVPDRDERGEPRYQPPNVSPRDVPSAIAIRKAHNAITGKLAEYFVGWFGATDARCFRYAGYDSINYGPDGRHAHGPNEFVRMDSLDTQLAVITHAAADLAGSGAAY